MVAGCEDFASLLNRVAVKSNDERLGRGVAQDFEGGIFVHSFLNVFDYHRQHAPAAGRIIEAKFIPGQVYLDVQLDLLDAEGRADENSSLANVAMPHRYLDAQDATDYQFVQCRGLFVLETAIGIYLRGLGLIAPDH